MRATLPRSRRRRRETSTSTVRSPYTHSRPQMASLMRVRSQGLPMAAARQTSSRVSAGDSVSTRPSICNRRVGVSSHRPLAIDSVSSLFGLLGGGPAWRRIAWASAVASRGFSSRAAKSMPASGCWRTCSVLALSSSTGLPAMRGSRRIWRAKSRPLPSGSRVSTMKKS